MVIITSTIFQRRNLRARMGKQLVQAHTAEEGAALGFRSCFVLFLLYLPWPHGPSFLCGAVSETLLAWNALILNPTEYSSHTPGRRFLPPSCSHITLHVYFLTGKCFVFTTRASAPWAEEPHVLSIFYPHCWACSSAYCLLPISA